MIKSGSSVKTLEAIRKGTNILLPVGHRGDVIATKYDEHGKDVEAYVRFRYGQEVQQVLTIWVPIELLEEKE